MALTIAFFGVGFFQATPVPVVTIAKAAATPATVDLSEYCNTATSTCYLCSRQLKSAELLERHVKESDLHKARTSFLQSGPDRVSFGIRLTCFFSFYAAQHCTLSTLMDFLPFDFVDFSSTNLFVVVNRRT